MTVQNLDEIALLGTGTYACLEKFTYAQLEANTYAQLEQCPPVLLTVTTTQAQSLALGVSRLFQRTLSLTQAQAVALRKRQAPRLTSLAGSVTPRVGGHGSVGPATAWSDWSATAAPSTPNRTRTATRNRRLIGTSMGDRGLGSRRGGAGHHTLGLCWPEIVYTEAPMWRDALVGTYR